MATRPRSLASYRSLADQQPVQDFGATVPQAEGDTPYNAQDLFAQGGSASNEYADGGAAPTGGDYIGPQFQGNTYSQPQFNPNTQTSDINQMYRDNRTSAYDTGNRLQQDFANQEDQRGQMENAYRGEMNRAYGDLKDNPGYTPGEQSQIVRDQQFNGLVTPQSKYNSLGMTDDEFRGTMGDTNSYMDAYHPEQLQDAQNAAAGYQRDQFQNAQGRLDNALADQSKGYDAAIDPSKLSLSSDYQNKVNDAIGTGAANIRGAVNKNDLTLDPSFAAGYRLSDGDVQRYQNQAATSLGHEYQSAIGDLNRSAAAAGNAGPLAVAAARSRLENQNAAQRADVENNAYLQAKDMQAQRNKTLEDMRLGANSNYAGMKAGTEQNLMNTAIGAGNTAEQLRLGSQQDISNRQMSAVGNKANAALGAGQYLGSAGIGMESGINNANQQVGQFNAQLGTGIKQAQDTANTNRWNNYYNTRVGNEQYGINSQFGQGMAVNSQLSNANTNVANARRQDQGAYRDWTSQQTGQQLQAGQNAGSQRLAAYGTQTGAVNGATNGLANWEIGNQGNTVLNKSLKTVNTLAGASAASQNHNQTVRF